MTASLNATLETFRTNLRQLLDEAVRQHTEGLLKQAEANYRQVLLHEPQQPEALNNLGVLLAETDRTNEALMVLRQAVTHHPTNPDYMLNLGRVESAAGNRRAAERSFRGAVEQDPANPEAALTLGGLLEQAGGLAEAEAVYRSLLATRPHDPTARLALARVAAALGRLQEAEAALRQAIADAPEAGEAHLRLGRLLLEDGRPDEAVAALRDALAVEAEPAEAHLALGEALAAAGRPAEAAEAFAAALERKPGWPAALSGRTRALVAAGRPREAADALDGPGAGELSAELLVERGRALSAAGKPEAALDSFGRAIAAEPTRAAAYLHLGPLLRSAGRAAEAERLFDYRSLLYWRRLPGVEGYGSTEAFDAALSSVIARRLRKEEDGDPGAGDPGARPGQPPAYAPLRCGAEITPELFGGRRGPVLEAFAALVARHMQAYLAERRGLAGTPYFAKPPKQVELRGHGLRLPASAFIEAHAHPEAYLSGVYYVEVPPEVAERRDSIAGCLRFSDAPRPSEWTSFETIRPKPGLLVLFPSYLWHAAVPFNAEGDRISIAFDLFPDDLPDPKRRYEVG
jgi:Tfp pilus assembly protein PilF